LNIVKAQVPFTLLVSVRQVETGDVIKSDCFSPGGQKVAREGDRVDDDLIRRLRNMNVRQVWVERTLPEWMSPAEAKQRGFDMEERHNVSPLHYQVLVNFQGTLSSDGIDRLLNLFENRLDSLTHSQKSELNKIRNDFEQIRGDESQLKQKINELNDQQLREAYNSLLSSARPQSFDPSDIKDGKPGLGRRIRSYLEVLQKVNTRLSDLVLELSDEEIESLVQLDEVDTYGETSNFIDSFLLFERLYRIPTIEDVPQVQTLFDSCDQLYREMFYEQTLNKELLNRISSLLWEQFDPDLPHWFMSLAQPGKPGGYLMAHSVNTAILTTQLYRNSDRKPDAEPREITLACLLMDIGMVLVPQSFHLHDQELTPDQKHKMKVHPIVSRDFYYDLSRKTDKTSKLIERHHERIDGSGYPRKLTSLSPDERLITLCDMFDAMASPRMWRSAIPPLQLFKNLRSKAATSMDKDWINVLIREIGIYPVGSVVRLSNDDPAVVVKHNHEDPKRPTVLPIRTLMNETENAEISLKDSELTIQSGGTSIKAPVGIRRKLIS